MTLTTPDPPMVRAASGPPVAGAGATGPSWLGELSPAARQFFLTAWRRRVGIALFLAVTALAAAGISLVLPKWYAASATILPPADTSESFGLMSALVENTALNKLGLFTSTTPSDIYVEILKSRTLREPLVTRHGLEERYDVKGMERALKELDTHVKVGVTPTGVVTVRVEDQDPRRAADMANDLVAGLDRFNRESVSTRAKRTREFLEGRLHEAGMRMASAESTLTAYEKKHKIVASTEAASVNAMADVMSQKLSLEVRRSYMSSYTRAGSASLREVEAEIAAMDREIGKLPTLKQEGSRLALNSEIQRRVFMLLTAQYEDMRVQEARDTPTLTVLDAARVPEVRARPRRALLVAVATAVAGLLAAGWVLVTMPRPGRA